MSTARRLELENNINRYRELARQIPDAQFQEGIATLITELEMELRDIAKST